MEYALRVLKTLIRETNYQLNCVAVFYQKCHSDTIFIEDLTEKKSFGEIEKKASSENRTPHAVFTGQRSIHLSYRGNLCLGRIFTDKRRLKNFIDNLDLTICTRALTNKDNFIKVIS